MTDKSGDVGASQASPDRAASPSGLSPCGSSRSGITDAGDDWLELLHMGMHCLWPISDQLSELASALRFTGQRDLADRLDALVARIDGAHELLTKGANGAVSSSLRASAEASNNMLRAAMAMAGVELSRSADAPESDQP